MYRDALCRTIHKRAVAWKVVAGEKFEPELGKLPPDIRVRIGALSILLSEFGPHLAARASTP
jgi:hypothetical protein